MGMGAGETPGRIGILSRCGALAGLLLGACSSGGDGASASSAAGPVPESLGLMKLTVNGLGTAAMSSKLEMVAPAGPLRPMAVTTVPQGIDLQQVSASSVDVGTNSGGGTRYFNVVYRLRNAQFCATPGTCTAYTTPRQNLTLLAADTSSSLDGTAVSGLFRFDGSAEPASLALGIEPTHGAELNSTASGVLVQPGYESLQVYTEAEIAGIPLDSGATGLFPYGYVAHNVNSASSRGLPANPGANQWDGRLAFSFKLPLQPQAKDDPYSITLVFQVIDDSNTRVTQSVEEQNAAGDAAAGARAAALGSSDLAVLGGRVAQTAIGDPICSVRTAGTAASPTAYLVNHAAAPVLASAAGNLQFVSPSAPLFFGFCAPMATPAAGTLVVVGSQSGRLGGTIGGGSSNRLSFTPAASFHPGELVSYSLTTGLQASAGGALAQAVVGSYLTGGTVPSSGAFGAASTSTIAGTGSNPSPNARAVAVGDFNGDGKLDLALADYSHAFSILLGNGDGTFQPEITTDFTPAIDNNSQSIAVGDFNGDGKLDLVLTSPGDNSVVVMLGDGTGHFGAPASYGVSSAPAYVTVGDFNGDGKLDLATANPGDGTVSVLLGDGSGGFGAASNYTIGCSSCGSQPHGIAIGDFNGDGKLDMAVTTNTTSANVYILLGNGDGSFNINGPTNAGGINPQAIVAGDFNGDGILDLVTADYGNSSITIALGKGNGTFVGPKTTTLFAGGGTPNSLAVGDFNGDGKLDLAVVNLASSIAVLPGRGDGTFGTATTYAAGLPIQLAVGDFNGDGRLDLGFTDAPNVSVRLGQP